MGEDVLQRRSLPPPITRALAHMQPGCAAKPRLALLLRQAARAASSSGGASRRTEEWVLSQANALVSAASSSPGPGPGTGTDYNAEVFALTASHPPSSHLCPLHASLPNAALLTGTSRGLGAEPGGPSWLLTSDDSAPERHPAPGQLPGSVSQGVEEDVAPTSIAAGRLTDGGHWGPGQAPSGLLLGGPLPAAVRHAINLQHPSSSAAASAAAAAVSVAAHGMVVDEAQDVGLRGWLHDAPRRSRARLSAGKVGPAPPATRGPPHQASLARRGALSRGQSESGLSLQSARGRRAMHGPSAVLRARGSVLSSGCVTASGALQVDAAGSPPARRSFLPPPGPMPPPSPLPAAQGTGSSSQDMRTGPPHVAAAKRRPSGTNLMEGTSKLDHLHLTSVDDRTAGPLKPGPSASNLNHR